MLCGLSKARKSVHTDVTTFDCGLGDRFINPIVELMVQTKEEGTHIATDADDKLVTIVLSDQRVSLQKHHSPNSRPSPPTKQSVSVSEARVHQPSSLDKSTFTVKHAFPNSSHMRLLLNAKRRGFK